MYTWTTSESGLIVIKTEAGEVRTPTLTGARAALMEHVLARWGAMARVVAERYGFPSEWLLAMIFQESGGDPRIESGFGDGGVGLLQITSKGLKAGHSNEQLKDPALNMDIGARFIARQLIPMVGRDFPKVSAAFNAGSLRPTKANEWGYVCTGSHIDSEVCAVNYQILRDHDEMAKAVGLQFDLQSLIPQRTEERDV